MCDLFNFYFIGFFHPALPFASLDGECTRTPDGILERNGYGVHTTAGGIIYRGTWKNDKVYLFLKISKNMQIIKDFSYYSNIK